MTCQTICYDENSQAKDVLRNYDVRYKFIIVRVLFLTTFLTFNLLLFAGTGNGQDINTTKVSLNLQNVPLRKVLQDIERQTFFRFIYKTEEIKKIKNITFNESNVILASVLGRLLGARGLSFQQIKTNILIKEARSDTSTINLTSLLNNLVNQAENDIISGKVTDPDGKPIEGVSVVVKGKTVGTTTNASGTFHIETEKDDVLVFTIVGYENLEVKPNGRLNLSVAMNNAASSLLGDVVVIGYGSAKKRNYTGAVSSISTKDILQNPQADISNTLAGRLPGIIAVQPGGQPGSDGSSIYIRGVSTTGNNSALIVVDGIPRDDYGFSQIDPNEIETLTVLKDAAAAAVFGVRGANGVILITTKRGKSGKPVFSFSARHDVQKPTRLPDFLGSFDMAVLYNEGLRNEGKPEFYTADDLQKYKDGSSPDTHPDTDWFKVGLKSSAPTDQYNLNASGGTDKVRYFFSLGYLDQKGLYNNVGFKRYNLRSNIDIDATPSTNIKLDVSGRFEDRVSPYTTTSNLFYAMTRIKPTEVAYFSNGLPGLTPSSHPKESVDKSGYRRGRSYVMMNVLSITQNIPFVTGLSLKGVFAYDKNFNISKNWGIPYELYKYNPQTGEYTASFATISTPLLDVRNSDDYNSTAEFHIRYDRQFGNHGLRALVLYSQNTFEYNELSGQRNVYLSASIDDLNAGSAASSTNSGSSGARARQGAVGRINYDFMDKYFLEANFRYDGSENFSKANRWGFFPAVSAGWKISDEGFIKRKLPVIDYLKIRGSWGQLGNDKIQRGAYLSSYDYGDNAIINDQIVQTIAEGRIGNPNFTWERATSYNIGLDGTASKNKFSFEFDYFSKRTKDILGTRNLSIAATSGIPNTRRPYENIAIVDNKGFEISLGYNNVINKNFKYFFNANYTYTKNKLVFADESPNVPDYQRNTGRPLNQLFGYQSLGLFQSLEDIAKSPAQAGVIPGDIKFKDIDGNGIIDGSDQTFIGNSVVPRNVFGLTLGVSFKGFDFSMLWQGANKVSAMPRNESVQAFFNFGKALKRHLDRWAPDNPDATYPVMTSSPNANTSLQSSFFLLDASYLRLKNVYLSYTISNKLFKKNVVKDIKIFVSGQNLITISDIKDFDPEGLGQGNGRGWFYPQEKVYAMGVNFNF